MGEPPNKFARGEPGQVDMTALMHRPCLLETEIKLAMYPKPLVKSWWEKGKSHRAAVASAGSRTFDSKTDSAWAAPFNAEHCVMSLPINKKYHCAVLLDKFRDPTLIDDLANPSLSFESMKNLYKQFFEDEPCDIPVTIPVQLAVPLSVIEGLKDLPAGSLEIIGDHN